MIIEKYQLILNSLIKYGKINKKTTHRESQEIGGII